MKAKSMWTLGGVVLILIIVLSNLIFGIIPTAMSIQRVDAQIRTTKAQNATRMHYLTILRNRAKNKDHFYVSLSKQRSEIPSSLQVVEFMNQLDVQAQRDNVTIANLTVSLPQAFAVPASITHSGSFGAAAATLPGGQLMVAPVSISVKGNLDEIQRFLNGVESIPRYMLVSSVSAQPFQDVAGKQATGTMIASLSGQIFTYGGQ